MQNKHFPTIIFLAAVITRLVGFGTSAIWYDEAISRFRASLPLPNPLTNLSVWQGENLWELILRPFVHGPLWVLRLPALLCAIASLYISWLLMERLQYTMIQQTAAWLPLITLPGLIWMAQDARYYAAISLLYLLAIYAAITQRIWLLVLTSILLAYIHPIGMVYGIAAWCIAVIDRTPLSKLWTFVMVIAAWLLHLYIIIIASRAVSIPAPATTSFWLQRTDLLYILAQTIISISANTLQPREAILLLIIISSAAILALFKLRERPVRIVWLAASLPLTGMLMIGKIWQPVYFYRTFQPSVPALCLLGGLVLIPGRRWFTWILPVLAFMLMMLAIGNWDPTSRGGHVDDIADFIRNNWQDGDILYYGTGTVAMPFDYYLHDKSSYIMDAKQNLNLTWPGIPFESVRLEDIEYSRAWVIYPLEPLIDSTDMNRLKGYTQDGTIIWQTSAIQFAPITIWLVDSHSMQPNHYTR